MKPSDYMDVIDRALAEDLLIAGDITSNSVVPVGLVSGANVVSREAGIVAGGAVARAVFHRVDPDLEVEVLLADGLSVDPDEVVATVRGRARSMLTAERTALNILGRMSGVATATRRLVDAVEGTGAQITDTRKTMPGLRVLDKAAVIAGGGVNHRMGLYDAVLIKDNHIAAAGDIKAAVAQARTAVGPGVMVEVEVDTLDQLEEVLGTGAGRVMLDNMDAETMRTAVEMVDGRMEVEASGGVTLETVRAIAATGVDMISVGWITHSAPQLDLGLDFD